MLWGEKIFKGEGGKKMEEGKRKGAIRITGMSK